MTQGSICFASLDKCWMIHVKRVSSRTAFSPYLPSKHLGKQNRTTKTHKKKNKQSQSPTFALQLPPQPLPLNSPCSLSTNSALSQLTQLSLNTSFPPFLFSPQPSPPCIHSIHSLQTFLTNQPSKHGIWPASRTQGACGVVALATPNPIATCSGNGPLRGHHSTQCLFLFTTASFLL